MTKLVRGMMRVTSYVCTALLIPLHALAQSSDYQGTWWATLPGSESSLRVTISQVRGSAVSARWAIRSQVHNSWSYYSVRALQTGPKTFARPLHVTRRVEKTGSAGDSSKQKATHPVIRQEVESETMGTVTVVFADENNGSLTYGEMNYHISRPPKESTP